MDSSQADIADLRILLLKPTSTADLMEDALVLAVEKNLSAYDASYAVLAKHLNIPLMTADEQLSKAMETAIFLGDFEIAPFEEK